LTFSLRKKILGVREVGNSLFSAPKIAKISSLNKKYKNIFSMKSPVND